MSPIAQVCVCSDYFLVDDDGSLCLKPGTMGLRQVLYFSDPGSYTFEKADYPWLAHVRVRVQGAGGGSAGAQADAGEMVATAGGTGGGYSERFIDVSALGASESITVGAGGVAGDFDTDGGAGGSSSFGGSTVAPGGFGGPVAMTTGTGPVVFSGVNGPLAGTGDIRMGGGASGGPFRLSGSQGQSGKGGDSFMGTGGRDRASNGGSSPRGFGGGAGGTYARSGATQDGTAGGNGLVIVELYG